MKKRTLVVLAAGMGSRYGGLKQLDTMSEQGDTIIDFSIYDAIQAGFTKVVFIIRESFKEDFQKVYDERLKGKIEVAYVCQELDKIPTGFDVDPERVKPWGTGHALLVTKDVVDSNFIVINGDDFYSRQAFVDIAEKLDELEDNEMAMVAYQLKNTISENGYVSRGECFLNEKDQLIGIEERTHIEQKDGGIYRKDDQGTFVEMDKDTTVSMNFFGFTPKFFEALETEFNAFLAERSKELKSEFYIPLVVNNLVEKELGNVHVLTSTAKWMGVTYAEDKPLVTAEVKKMKENQVYPKNLWA